MLRAKDRCQKLWHIHAVEELDGMDFAVGIRKLEAKGSNALDLQAFSKQLLLLDIVIEHKVLILILNQSASKRALEAFGKMRD